jgi:hypothetical protein
MGMITRFFGYMTVLSGGGFLLALFTDTSTGDYPYTAWEAFFGWVFFTFIFTILRRRRR